MSFLYRTAITITRKQPYLDWANSFDDGGPILTPELSSADRTIYLVPESDDQPNPSRLLDEFWEHIFEEELAAWMVTESDWPAPLTRDKFNAWFDAEVVHSVYDLVPDEPLTEADVEEASLEDAARRCAWCDIEVEEDAGRLVAFKLSNREPYAHREGLVFAVPLDDEHVAMGIMSKADSAQAQEGEDILFLACTSRCEKILRKAVPKALRKIPVA